MSFGAITVFVISVLAAFVQVKFQSKGLSPFDTHYGLMSTFFVVLFTFVAAWATETVQGQAQNTRNDNHGVWTKISLISGALASILLLIILIPFLGWVGLVFWTLYFVKTAYELAHDAIFEILNKMSEAIDGRFDHKQEDNLPV